MSIRQYSSVILKSLLLLLILLQLVATNCDRMPSGPKIPEESKLAVFCVLNPAQQNQTIQLQRTLTYTETVTASVADLDVSDARIILIGPDGQFEAEPMLPSSRPTAQKDTNYTADFLWGTSHFNYLLRGDKIQSGEHYSLSVATEEYGSIEAETIVPGPFQITEVNIEPELTTEQHFSEDTTFNIMDFRITWTESSGAAGYLVDIVLLQYDFSEWVNTWDLSNELGPGWAEDFVIPDSVDLVDVPYTEIPMLFRTIHGKLLRGFLTRETEWYDNTHEVWKKYSRCNQRIWLDNCNICRLRIAVHALSKPLFDFTAFQYLRFDEGEVIGQEVVLPDLSNVRGGVGVFGAATTQTAFSRLIGLKDSPVDPQLVLSRPQNLQPDNDATLPRGGSLTLSWDPVPDATLYLLVLKPHYLWFYPGNHVYLVRDTHLEIFQKDFPYRDCRIEWYLRAIKENENDYTITLMDSVLNEFGIPFYDDSTGVFAVGPGKGPLVLYGYYIIKDVRIFLAPNRSTGYGINCYVFHDYSLWSESRFIHIPSGELTGFTDSGPVLTAPPEEGLLSPTGTLRWQEVQAADAYLIYIHSSDQTVIAVTKETEISPPFPDEIEWADGLAGLDAFQSGATYFWQVCALRVRTGALGFVVDAPRNGQPPRVYPRYTHPSGIMLMSRWSEKRRFVVQ